VALESPRNVPSEPQEISERGIYYRNQSKSNILATPLFGILRALGDLGGS